MRGSYLSISVLAVCLAISAVHCAKEKSTDLSIVDFGADASGNADSTTAIQNAINQARSSGVNVYVPPGTFKHNDILKLTGTNLYGDGVTSILYATDQENRAVQMEGSNAVLRNLKVTGVSQPRNNKGWNNSVFVNYASNFRIADVTIMPTTNFYAYMNNGEPAVYGIGGVIIYYSNNGVIERNTVAWTWADGIHTTGKSSGMTIQYNTVHHVGDDSIPVVSYAPDEVSNVLIYRNTISDNVWARGIPVIGGYNIRVIENTLTNILSAAFWVASEGSYQTTSPHDIIYARNTVVNATNYKNACSANYGGLPTTGTGNGNPSQGNIYNVLFVDNSFTGACTQHIRTEGDTIGEVVYAGNTFKNSQSTIVELQRSLRRGNKERTIL